MIKFKNVLAAVFMFAALFSCSNEKSENHHVNPKAFQDNKKTDFKSYSRPSDITEELYQELVSNNPELQKLEDQLNAFNPKEAKSKFNNYNSKSSSYYDAANHKIAALSDSVLKEKMMNLMASSSQQYDTNTAELNSLITQVSKNGTTIRDQHTVLKIMLTLPLLEEYQKVNKPKKNELMELINQQLHLIQRLDTLTPAL